MNALSSATKLTGVLVRLLIVFAVVFGAAVAASLLVDRVNPPVATVDPGIASIDSTKHSRIVILHIDSWRYETAIDSSMMPQTARLRKLGASFELETVFEGFTIPAVRAAFSGREETQLVSLIQNFSFSALPIGSFFLDAHRLGKKTLVVAEEPWVQFGPYYEKRLPEKRGRDMYAVDHDRPGLCFDGYLKENFDIIVCHYESADWVAHETGIHSARYRQEFLYADSLVAQLAGMRAPTDYLLVYGDHGHSETGEHKTGIHIPTFALLLGPDVKAGVTTAPLAMTNLRFIVSHALGINLRAAPYDVREISRFLPVASDAAAGSTIASQSISRKPTDYLLALVVAGIAMLLGVWLTRRVDGESPKASVLVAATIAFLIELALQQKLLPAFSLFPLLLLGFALPAQRPAVERILIAGVALFFVAQIAVHASGAGPTLAPTSMWSLAPLYTCAIAAKLFVLAGSIRTARWKDAVAWTTALALLEFRVWDHPASTGLLLLAGLSALALVRATDVRRMALIAVLQSLLYFTLRLPLYQLAWIDLYLVALYLVARNRSSAGVDMLTIMASFTLTCGWLASSLEWGFLYTVFPAHLVELQVQYFGPFILAKIPLLMLLSLVVAGQQPTRRFVSLLLLYAALRFAAAWTLRLLGASGADLWPLAEQGMYLATFVVAAVTWGWTARVRTKSELQTPSPTAAPHATLLSS
ncbi:MAG: hypothetical protein ACO1Q7_05865 [Gemmatimonas sp.]